MFLKGIEFNNVAHGHAIAAAVGTLYNPANTVIARVRDGELLGGFMLDRYTQASICIHMAGFRPNWMNRSILCILFDYIFNQLRCKKAFAHVKETNRRAMDINLRAGFKFDTILKDVYPDGDLHILSMYDRECRWIRPRGAA